MILKCTIRQNVVHFFYIYISIIMIICVIIKNETVLVQLSRQAFKANN